MMPRLATPSWIVGFAAAAAVSLSSQTQFRSAVDVVELSVAVRSGRSVAANLVAADFQVLDNGVPQEILSVSRETLPMDVTLLLDTSESLNEGMFRSLVSAARRVHGRLRPADRVSLVTFNHRIKEQVALAPVRTVRSLPFGHPAGQTSLNDAIAVVLATRPVPDRRQMAIVFTDGMDSSSYLRESTVLALAARSNTTIFVVSLATRSGGGTTDAAPSEFFQRLTAATGGLAQTVYPYAVIQEAPGKTSVTRNDNLLDQSFLKALDDFAASYLLRYRLTGVSRAGWHAVEVTVVRPGRQYDARTRTGYSG